VVGALLQQRLEGKADVDGHAWVVTSAGTADIWPEIDRHMIAAAKEVGVDVSGHQRRTLTKDILHTHGADLIITMTREHLRAVIAIDASAWPRTFTLKELARRAVSVAPASSADGYTSWLSRLAAGRKASEMMHSDLADDIADPYGRPRRDHDAMVATVQHLVDEITRAGPWH
jgi:protein-tyrosine-phosphatase